MTRINVGFRPYELTNKHLLAEHREIKRIGNCIKSGRFTLSNIPPEFTLGTGHVKFFYNKLKYVHERYNKLYEECIRRGFSVSNFEDAFSNMPSELYNDYTEQPQDREILLGRLIEKDSFYLNINNMHISLNNISSYATYKLHIRGITTGLSRRSRSFLVRDKEFRQRKQDILKQIGV